MYYCIIIELKYTQKHTMVLPNGTPLSSDKFLPLFMICIHTREGEGWPCKSCFVRRHPFLPEHLITGCGMKLTCHISPQRDDGIDSYGRYDQAENIMTSLLKAILSFGNLSTDAGVLLQTL